MKVLLFGSDMGTAGSGFSMMALAKCLDGVGVETVQIVRDCGAFTKKKRQRGKYYIVDAQQSWVYSMNCPRIKKICVGLMKGILNIKPYFQMLRIIHKENPDIVHVNDSTIYIGAVAALKCHKKLVWHIRELLEEDLGVQWLSPTRAKRLMSKADCLISISKCVYNKFHMLMPQVPNSVIYNGVDMSYYKNEEHRIFDKDHMVFTIAGRVSVNKGQFETLKGLTNILKIIPNVELWIAGSEHKSGKEVEKLKEYMRKKEIKEDRVKFLGFVEDMASVWAKTDVAIVASKCEAFGRVTVEAMASGCLVLGADSGATPELITYGETGLLYQQGNAEDLGTKAKYILEHKTEMRQIAAAGREYAIANFTAEKNAREIKKLYEELIENE